MCLPAGMSIGESVRLAECSAFSSCWISVCSGLSTLIWCSLAFDMSVFSLPIPFHHYELH